MKVLIKITKEVLERSKMCDTAPDFTNASSNCAVSLAVIDLFPGARTYNTFMYLICDGIFRDANYYITIPQVVSEFIGSFDWKTPEERVLMTPFYFEIEVPEYVIDKIGISTIYKVLSESSTLEMVM